MNWTLLLSLIGVELIFGGCSFLMGAAWMRGFMERQFTENQRLYAIYEERVREHRNG